MSERVSERRNNSAVCDVFSSQDCLAAAAEEPDDLEVVLKERSVKEEVNHSDAAADLLLHEDGKIRKTPTGSLKIQEAALNLYDRTRKQAVMKSVTITDPRSVYSTCLRSGDITRQILVLHLFTRFNWRNKLSACQQQQLLVTRLFP